jgi:hypothetical protein
VAVAAAGGKLNQGLLELLLRVVLPGYPLVRLAMRQEIPVVAAEARAQIIQREMAVTADLES